MLQGGSGAEKDKPLAAETSTPPQGPAETRVDSSQPASGAQSAEPTRHSEREGEESRSDSLENSLRRGSDSTEGYETASEEDRHRNDGAVQPASDKEAAQEESVIDHTAKKDASTSEKPSEEQKPSHWGTESHAVEPIEPSSNHKHTASTVSKNSTTDKVLHGDTGAVSEWSHQALAPREVQEEKKITEDEWQTMPAYAPYDLYDDDNRLVAREAPDSDDEANPYHGLGGAGKGYTRVQNDEDAKSATSMDDDTNYLFKPKNSDLTIDDDDDEQRDPLAQLQATKELLTEGQRIAYVGITRLALVEMVTELEQTQSTRGTKKVLNLIAENTKLWSQKMMVRLYMHMDINSSGKSYLSLACMDSV